MLQYIFYELADLPLFKSQQQSIMFLSCSNVQTFLWKTKEMQMNMLLLLVQGRILIIVLDFNMVPHLQLTLYCFSFEIKVERRLYY